MGSRAWVGSRGLTLAVLTWLYQGIWIGTPDLRDYTLQHAGIEALVERGTFDVRGSATPRLRPPMGDTFELGGRLMGAKQPGQWVFGAAPYSVLRALGVSYRTHYDWAAAWTTWLSSGLATASAVYVLWQLLTRLYGFASAPASIAALSYGLGSTALAYAGVAHHDLISSALLIWMFYFMESARVHRTSGAAAASGVLAGAVVSCSFLAVPIVATLLVYTAAFAWRTPARVAALTAGFLSGIAPLCFYNWHYFGNPLLQANLAGNYADTFFHLDSARAWSRLELYLGLGSLSLWKYAPLVAAGPLGLALFPERLSGQRWMLFSALLMHLVYILNIETYGHCQYGPRYLMPFQVLAAIGVARLFELGERARLLKLGVYAALSVGCVISSVGAQGGTMNCLPRSFAFPLYLEDWEWLMRGSFPLRPLALCLLLGAAGVAAAAHYRAVK